MAAFTVYENQLIDGDDRETTRVAFQALTLESIIEAMQAAGANDLARDLWHRYADFERIYISHFTSSLTAHQTTPPPPRLLRLRGDPLSLGQRDEIDRRTSAKGSGSNRMNPKEVK